MSAAFTTGSLALADWRLWAPVRLMAAVSLSGVGTTESHHTRCCWSATPMQVHQSLAWKSCAFGGSLPSHWRQPSCCPWPSVASGHHYPRDTLISRLHRRAAADPTPWPRDTCTSASLRPLAALRVILALCPCQTFPILTESAHIGKLPH